MHVHEYQAKQILKECGIPMPDFEVVSNLEQVQPALQKLGLSTAVIKIQVHAGGRGKAGGVQIANTPEQILQCVKKLIGLKMVNQQTGKEGIVAREVMISAPVDIKKEYYLAVTIDRHNAQAMLILSPEGGADIEELAKKAPERIKTIPLAPNGTIRNYQLLEAIKFMGWEGDVAAEGKQMIKTLCQAFIKTDATLLEINPLVLTKQDHLTALDAKLTIDDNALFRQQKIANYYDPTQLIPSEARAKEFDLAYIALDGNIGCMVNGAGLAMSTMDIIQHYGGAPANFLDVGGGADEAKIAEGFKIILSDAKVKAILVNIFGGIMNCETLARGIIAATKVLRVHVPLVIRMEGTHVEKGKQLLAESGLNIIVANELADAASKAVTAARRSK